MGGFTGLFDRPDPTVARLTKNPAIQRQIDANLADYTRIRGVNNAGLSDFIRQYLADQGKAESATGQETGVIDQFYDGTMTNRLADLRQRTAGDINSAADIASSRAIRSANASQLGEQGSGSSYDTRQRMAALIPIRTAAALQKDQQERSDLDYVTGNQLGLAGARTNLRDALANRALVPGQVSSAVLGRNNASLAPIISEDQANKFYGIQQKPGLLDRMQQEVQFLQGLQSIMKNQYGTAAEAYGGWSSMGGGGGGGGGGMGGGTGFSFGGMRRGGMVRADYRGGGEVDGPGSGTSDSIPARLSDGEYVMPASAVRMPGVLALLEHIRNEGLHREEVHMSGGGLLYADSFGGLGAQALARDQFNEATMASQQAAAQQQSQFDTSAALERQKLNQDQQKNKSSDADKNMRQALDYYSMGAAGRTGVPDYSPRRETGENLDVYAHGGLVYRTMTPVRSVPKGYADGGVVGSQSDDEYLQASRKFLRQALDDAMKRAKEGRSYRDVQLGLQQQYQDWTMHQPTPAADRSRALKLKYGEELATQGGDVSGLGLEPDDEKTLQKIADSQNEAIDSMHGHAKNLADVLNKKEQIDRSIPILTQQRDAQHRTILPNKEDFATFDQQLQNAQQEQSRLTKVIGTIDPKHLQGLVTYDPKSGKYVPAVKPSRKSSAVTTAKEPTSPPGTGNSPDNAPVAPTPPPKQTTNSGGYQGRYSPRFYDRVTDLMSTGKFNKDEAARQAMREMINNLP